MGDWNVIEAAKSEDFRALEGLLANGAHVNEQDELGWTPLCWAAGRGDAEMIKVLLEHGADVSLVGRDRRTPRMIAKAADRGEAAELLAQAEKERGLWVDPRERQAYCRAYYLKSLRRFPGWAESRMRGSARAGSGLGTLADEDIVYLHQDLTVTRSMWRSEGVVFDQVTPEWRTFCEKELEFQIPEDLV